MNQTEKKKTELSPGWKIFNHTAAVVLMLPLLAMIALGIAVYVALCSGTFEMIFGR